jgi:nucleotide-binding universal stress UspA family protein
MLTSIVVPVDGSPAAEEAIPLAAHIARRSNARLELVLAHDPFVVAATMNAPGVTGHAFAPSVLPYAQLESDTRESQEQYVGRLAPLVGAREGVPTEATFLVGNVVDVLSNRLDERGDLAVMTTHGRGGIARFWLGSVAESLLRRVVKPILLVKPSETAASAGPALGADFSHVLVPVDGTDGTLAIVDPALEIIASGPGALQCSVLLVRSPMSTIALANLAGAEGPSALELASQGDAERTYLERMARPFEARGIPVARQAVTHTNVARAILEHATRERCDLILLQTRGRSGLARALSGSVADKIIRGSDAPVLVFKRDEST